MTRIVRIFLTLSMLLTLCTSCAGTPLSRTQTYMDTVCTATLYDGTDAALDACFDTVKEWDARWSRTVEDSDVTALNRANGAAVTVHADTAALLRLATEYAVLTDGALDITTAALTDLWKAAEDADTLPDDAALADALARVGASYLLVDGDRAALQNGAQIDLGAIAKGAVADKAADTLRQHGCTSALLDFGGNIVAVGNKPNGEPFHIGIADPLGGEALIATVAVSDTSVVTSGSYERGYTIGGKRYSHILDPQSGQPVDNDLLSVTILSPHSVDGDALSTACFVMGYEKARALIDTLDDIEAVFVLKDSTVVATDGVDLV